MSPEPLPVAVLGGSGLVGPPLLSCLHARQQPVIAYSRTRHEGPDAGVVWRLSSVLGAAGTEPIAVWFCLAPIWVLPDYFEAVRRSGARRIVALSSTSRYTKLDSSDSAERDIVKRLIDGEQALIAWAERHGVEWVILRSTLIYGYGRDRNVGAVAAFIRRFGFFPLLGKACGLRQPLHAEDLARAMVAAAWSKCAANRSYTLSGSETLTYRAMVERIFTMMGRRPRLPSVPFWMFRVAVAVWRAVQPRSTVSIGMAERMNADMVFDHDDAVRDFGFASRAFSPTQEDLSG
ncbi:NAD-dependent epimerase/dehydratase family protein [Methyloversatilis sp.]|uniref:NAD-dependent epimerase/dehydratase family protein n=1 Tax=Methyloversatilis sp. TaxID=2569862 RepID=UPI003D2B1203